MRARSGCSTTMATMASHLNRPPAVTHRSHGLLVALLLAIGTLAAIAAAGAWWIDRQALSTPRWTTTSSRLIANGHVRTAISDYAVREAFAGNGIDAALGHALPSDIARHTRSELHHAASRLVDELLSSGPGRRAWRDANRSAHAQLVASVNDSNRRAGITLDLAPLLHDLLHRLARTPVARSIPGGEQVLGAPAHAARLQVATPDRTRTVAGWLRPVRTLVWALPLGALVAFVLAIMLSGWRRAVTFTRVGYCLVLAGAVVLVARALAGPAVANGAVSSATDRRGVRAAWSIATGDLRTAGVAALVAGVIVALVGLVSRLVRA